MKKIIYAIIFLYIFFILSCNISSQATADIQVTARIVVKVTIVSLEAPCLSKSADKIGKDIKIGEIVTYTIRYDNDLDRPVENFSIIDEIPAGTRYIRDSAEIDNQPHKDAKVLVEYWDGKLWRGSNWDNTEGAKVQKIRWSFTEKISPQDNDEGNDTKNACDGDFPDADAGIIMFRVFVERVIIE